MGLVYGTTDDSLLPSSPSHYSNTITVIVCGRNCALSIYNIGGQLKFQHLRNLAGYVKDKVATYFLSFIPRHYTAPSGPVSEDERSLTSQLDFIDSKRHIIRMIADSTARLIATADSLGRVMLYDTRLNAMIRLWKGFRDARLAWSETHSFDAHYMTQAAPPPSSATTGTHPAPSRPRLALLIYAPHIGLLHMYGMKHGPLLRTIPLGNNAHICTLYQVDAYGGRLAFYAIMQSFAV